MSNPCGFSAVPEESKLRTHEHEQTARENGKLSKYQFETAGVCVILFATHNSRLSIFISIYQPSASLRSEVTLFLTHIYIPTHVPFCSHHRLAFRISCPVHGSPSISSNGNSIFYDILFPISRLWLPAQPYYFVSLPYSIFIVLNRHELCPKYHQTNSLFFRLLTFQKRIIFQVKTNVN